MKVCHQDCKTGHQPQNDNISTSVRRICFLKIAKCLLHFDMILKVGNEMVIVAWSVFACVAFTYTDKCSVYIQQC